MEDENCQPRVRQWLRLGHEVVLSALDWGWCITSFGRQLDKLRARAPPGCDAAYNVLQQ